MYLVTGVLLDPTSWMYGPFKLEVMFCAYSLFWPNLVIPVIGSAAYVNCWGPHALQSKETTR